MPYICIFELNYTLILNQLKSLLYRYLSPVNGPHLLHRARSITALRSFALLSLLLLTPALCNADDSSDLKKVQNSLKQVKQNLKTDTSKRSKTQGSLEKIERDIAQRLKRQRLTQEKQAKLDEAVQELKIEKAQITAHFDRMQTQLVEVIRAN